MDFRMTAFTVAATGLLAASCAGTKPAADAGSRSEGIPGATSRPQHHVSHPCRAGTRIGCASFDSVCPHPSESSKTECSIVARTIFIALSPL